MVFSRKYKEMYVLTTIGYGVLRKIPILANAEVVNYVDGESKKLPMLMSTKGLIIGFTGLASIYYWPFWLYSDVSRAEAYIRGIPYSYYRLYGEPRHYIDYVLE